MKYTLQKLFEVVDERKEEREFYYSLSSGGWGADYYLNRITSYNPNKKIIVSSDRNKEAIKNENIKYQEVEVDGLLLYEYISHTEEYIITRFTSIEEITDIICSEKGLLNMFSGDIIVIEDGRRKKYYVKDIDGDILNWSDIDRIKKQNIDIYIEWK